MTAQLSFLPTPHVTAAELAAMRLPGWPTTPRGWNMLREQHGWATADRHGARGVRLWLADGLPADLIAAIEAWRSAAAERAVAPMAARRGRPAGSGWFDRHPDQAEAVLSYVGAHKHSATNVLRLLSTQFTEVPDLRTLQRYIRQLEASRPATLMRHRDPDQAKNRFQLALGKADGGVTHAHQVWQLDTTKADVMTIGGRKMVLGLIDVWSRRVRLMVADSESGQSVRRLLIEAIEAWGVMPETVVTDNGSGYVNQAIVSALELLGIAHERCLPGSPERKPFVERMFAGFMHHRAPLLPGFTGKNVAEAQALRGRAKKKTGRAEILASLTAEQLQDHLDNWVDGHYHLTPHSGTGQPPLARCLATPVPATAAPPRDVLVAALSAWVGVRTVGKHGVEWKGGRYWCAEAAVWMGRQVIVRRNEDDLGALLLFDQDQHFIGKAVDFERSGLSERDYAIAARNHQRRHDSDEAKRVRAAERKYPIEQAVNDMLRAEAEASGKLAILPPRTVSRPTAQVDSFTAPPPILPSAADLARADRHMAAKPAPGALDVLSKIAAADAVILAAQQGQQPAPAELQAAQAYVRSTEYRAQKLLMEPAPRPAPVQPFSFLSERQA